MSAASPRALADWHELAGDVGCAEGNVVTALVAAKLLLPAKLQPSERSRGQGWRFALACLPHTHIHPQHPAHTAPALALACCSHSLPGGPGSAGRAAAACARRQGDGERNQGGPNFPQSEQGLHPAGGVFVLLLPASTAAVLR